MPAVASFRTSAPRVRVLLAAGLVLVLTAGGAGWMYNRLARSEERVNEAWAQVANVLQRRADLVPNLVAVTAAHAAHERALAGELARAHAAYVAAHEATARVDGARRLEHALREIRLAGERYPELGRSAPFTRLGIELAGSENRITIERARYNAAVREHRALLRRIPWRWVAALGRLPEPPPF